MVPRKIFALSFWGIFESADSELPRLRAFLIYEKERKKMARELPKVYEPQQVESKIYDMWQRGGYFHAEVDESKKPFTIVMPPPNVALSLRA